MKSEKAKLFQDHIGIFGEWSCGCVPTQEPCDCDETCTCETSVVLCRHMQNWEFAETERLLDRMAEFYLAVDPENYSVPPVDKTCSLIKGRKNYVLVMAERVARGCKPKNPKDRYYDLEDRSSEVIETCRNGAVRYTGRIVREGDESGESA